MNPDTTSSPRSDGYGAGSEQKNPPIEMRRFVRTAVPHIPFGAIAYSILPERYELSLVLCGDALARKMNRTYREKNYAANVLSFPYSNSTGEIFLNVHAARREARKCNVTFRERLALLFVHACLHLKGMRHGARMDREEVRILRRFV